MLSISLDLLNIHLLQYIVARGEWQDALVRACHALDMSKPLVLPRHERDWEQFSQARFLKEHFVEDVPFDRMEVEFIDPDQKRKQPGIL